jgi:hypothetical protein
VAAVKREQVVAIKVGQPLQPLAALQLTKQRGVERAQPDGINRIEAFAKARVARRTLDPIERFEIRPHRSLLAVVIELQRRGILQPKERRPRHQMIDQRDAVVGAVGNPRKHPPRLAQQSLDAESLAAKRGAHRSTPAS